MLHGQVCFAEVMFNEPYFENQPTQISNFFRVDAPLPILHNKINTTDFRLQKMGKISLSFWVNFLLGHPVWWITVISEKFKNKK